jgi:membrane protein involved in colicin uptake
MLIKSMLVAFGLAGATFAATQSASADSFRTEHKIRAEEKREVRTERREERIDLKDRRLRERERLEQLRLERLRFEHAKRGC